MQSLSRSELAQLIDGASLERELERLGRKGAGWIEVASVLSRRINWTLDWADLGPDGARYSVIGSRGEAVLLWDNLLRNRIMKLRGQEVNGFGGAGFGCILGRGHLGRICYQPGTLDQAIERESLSWQHLGFSCYAEAIIEDEAGLLLAQDFIVGSAPTEQEIQAYMLANGWDWLQGCRKWRTCFVPSPWLHKRVREPPGCEQAQTGVDARAAFFKGGIGHEGDHRARSTRRRSRPSRPA